MSLWNLLFGTNDQTRNSQGKKLPYTVYTYRTKDGVAYFKFSYHWVAGHYEIDIHEFPSYESRKSDSVTCHWLPSIRKASRKICIYANKAPKTLEDAQKFSMAWAELTWTYITTGVKIDTQINLRK